MLKYTSSESPKCEVLRTTPGDSLDLVASAQFLQRPFEATGVALFSLGQRLEPLRDLREALVARGLGEAGVHRLVLVGLTGDGALQIFLGVADRLARGGVADLLEK